MSALLVVAASVLLAGQVNRCEARDAAKKLCTSYEALASTSKKRGVTAKDYDKVRQAVRCRVALSRVTSQRDPRKWDSVANAHLEAMRIELNDMSWTCSAISTVAANERARRRLHFVGLRQKSLLGQRADSLFYPLPTKVACKHKIPIETLDRIRNLHSGEDERATFPGRGKSSTEKRFRFGLREVLNASPAIPMEVVWLGTKGGSPMNTVSDLPEDALSWSPGPLGITIGLRKMNDARVKSRKPGAARKPWRVEAAVALYSTENGQRLCQGEVVAELEGSDRTIDKSALVDPVADNRVHAVLATLGKVELFEVPPPPRILPKSPALNVQILNVSVDGWLENADVMRTLERTTKKLGICAFGNKLAKDVRGRPGTFVMKAQVDDAGSVSELSVTGGFVAPEEVSDCVRRHLRRARYPEAEESSEIEATFELTE